MKDKQVTLQTMVKNLPCLNDSKFNIYELT